MKDGKYFVKPWKLMEEEFGLAFSGASIDCLYPWTKDMEEKCPKDRIIEVVDDKWEGYKISDDMLIGPAFKYGDEIEVSNDEKSWSKQIFYGIIPGYEYPYYTAIKGFCYKYARPIEKEKKDSFDFSVFNEYELHVKRVLEWKKREILAEVKKMINSMDK